MGPKYKPVWYRKFYTKKRLTSALQKYENIFAVSNATGICVGKILHACAFYGIKEVFPTKKFLLDKHLIKREPISKISEKYFNNEGSAQDFKHLFEFYNVKQIRGTKRTITKKCIVDKKILLSLYVDKKLSVRDVARSLGTTESVIHQSMNHHGVVDRHGKEWLYTRYWKDGLSLNAMAFESGMSVRSIAVRMKKNDIPTRSIKFPKTVKRVKREKYNFTKEEVYNSAKSCDCISELGRRLHCSPDTAKRYLQKYNIELESKDGVQIRFPQLRDSAWMYGQLNILNKPVKTLANEIGCNKKYIYKIKSQLNKNEKIITRNLELKIINNANSKELSLYKLN